MRITFIQTLQELAAKDERIVLLTGDLGFSVLEPFAEAFPDRFYNVGVSEQNMAGLAAGLAEAGLIPFIYSIAPFSTLRPYEFLRNGAIHQSLPVRIVAIGAGYAYGELGPSHHLLEDLSVFRCHENLQIVSPVDAKQTANLLTQSYDAPGAIYYRLGKNDKLECPVISGGGMGELATIRRGSDAVVFTTGEITAEICGAANQLSQQKTELEVQAISSINPLPREQIVKALAQHRYVITYEEHYANGGIGSLIAEIIAEEGLGCRLLRMAAQHHNDGLFGGRHYMLSKSGLTADQTAQRISAFLQTGSSVKGEVA